MRRGASGLRPVHIICLLLFLAPPAARLGGALWRRAHPAPAFGTEAPGFELEKLREELRRSRAELELFAAAPDPSRYRVGLADVIPLTDPSPRRGTLWVSPRKSDSVATDSAALWGGILVGRVRRVERGLLLAAVQTLADPAFRVRCRAGDATGILLGTARRDASGAPLLAARHLSREGALSPGHPVFTAGDDGIYPPGLQIGEVLAGTEGTGGGAGEGILVRAALDPDGLAQVVLAYDVAAVNLRSVVLEAGE